MSKTRRRKIHVATGMDALQLRGFVHLEQGVPDEDVIFHIAQCLSFLIQGSDAESLAVRSKVGKNRFAIRKLKSTLTMMDEVFDSEE